MNQELRDEVVAALEHLETKKNSGDDFNKFISQLETCSDDDFFRTMLVCVKVSSALQMYGLTADSSKCAKDVIFRTVILPDYERHLNKSLVAQSEVASKPSTEVEAKKQFIRDFFAEYNINHELLDAHLVIHHGIVYQVVCDGLKRTGFGAFMFKMYLKYKELSNA